MKKTKLIEGIVRIKKIGHACIGCMAWESPYIIFERMNGKEYVWHSDNIPEILDRHGLKHNYNLENKVYHVRMRVRQDRVWRLYNIIETSESGKKIFDAFYMPLNQ